VRKEYIITKTKYDNDLLQMDNYLLFKENKYMGRFARKQAIKIFLNKLCTSNKK
jgi:hypothetical protein